VGLTDGQNQATSIIISDYGYPFATTQSLCPSTPGSFSLQFAFSISAEPGTYNGISDGLTLSFIDAQGTTIDDIPWQADVSNVLVPALNAVTLEIDTKDDCCGSPDKPCTGTYTSYDNQRVAGCGTGYRLASPKVQDVPNRPLQDYVVTNLAYGGRYTSMTGGTNLAGVAVTGNTVMSQIDFTSLVMRRRRWRRRQASSGPSCVPQQRLKPPALALAMPRCSLRLRCWAAARTRARTRRAALPASCRAMLIVSWSCWRLTA